MGRPRTATNILDARGAFAKNPQRARKNEPKGKGSFKARPPAHLNTAQKDCWKQIAKEIPAGVLTGSDHIAVELCAVLLAEFRRCSLEDELMSAAHLARLHAMMGHLGLHPSGRAGLVVDKPKADPFDDL